MATGEAAAAVGRRASSRAASRTGRMLTRNVVRTGNLRFEPLSRCYHAALRRIA